jgi:hypothetical protein
MARFPTFLPIFVATTFSKVHSGGFVDADAMLSPPQRLVGLGMTAEEVAGSSVA